LKLSKPSKIRLDGKAVLKRRYNTMNVAQPRKWKGRKTARRPSLTSFLDCG